MSLGLWKCGCGETVVKAEGFAPISSIACYCDDCRTRTRVMQDRETPKSRKHEWAHDGVGMLETNVAAGGCSFVKGRENVGFFRAALTKDGTAYDRSRRTLNMYAKCCNTLICHLPDKHPWGLEFQAGGFEKFVYRKGKDGYPAGLYGTGDGRRGDKPLPDGIKAVDGAPARFGAAPLGMCRMVCCALLTPPPCPCCAPGCCACCLPSCCLCCAHKPKEPLFDLYPDSKKCPANATHFEGVEIEYIDDPKYLFPPPVEVAAELAAPAQQALQ